MSTLKRLPDHEQKCLCFGHKTFCCKEDMDDEPNWHEVTFKFHIASYKLKHEFPEDLEASILEKCSIYELWEIGEDPHEGHVIGVTKWKYLPKSSK